MQINVSSLCSDFDFDVCGASYIGTPKNNTAMYITKKVERLIVNLNQVNNCLVFAENNIDTSPIHTNICFVFSDNPQAEYAAFVQSFADEHYAETDKREYRLTSGGYYIGENVSIGKNAHIDPLCLIGHDVVIGDNARIMAGAKIKNSVIGNNAVIGEGCIIGADGFTMVKDKSGNNARIPTLGKVVIGNSVEIGTLTNISCGSSDNTVIEDYVKIDTLVHIAHDVHIHKNVEIPAGVIIGGYTQIGERAFIGINAAVRNRITIGEDAVIGMGATVLKDVDAHSVVVGNPAKPLKKD